MFEWMDSNQSRTDPIYKESVFLGTWFLVKYKIVGDEALISATDVMLFLETLSKIAGITDTENKKMFSLNIENMTNKLFDSLTKSKGRNNII